MEEIEKNDFNLNLPRYIDSQQPEDIQDIDGHLQGRHPGRRCRCAQAYWAVARGCGKRCSRPNRPGYLDLAVEKAAIKPTIYEHPEFAAFITGMNAHFADIGRKCDLTTKGSKPCRPGATPK